MSKFVYIGYLEAVSGTYTSTGYTITDRLYSRLHKRHCRCGPHKGERFRRIEDEKKRIYMNTILPRCPDALVWCDPDLRSLVGETICEKEEFQRITGVPVCTKFLFQIT